MDILLTLTGSDSVIGSLQGIIDVVHIALASSLVTRDGPIRILLAIHTAIRTRDAAIAVLILAVKFNNKRIWIYLHFSSDSSSFITILHTVMCDHLTGLATIIWGLAMDYPRHGSI